MYHKFIRECWGAGGTCTEGQHHTLCPDWKFALLEICSFINATFGMPKRPGDVTLGNDPLLCLEQDLPALRSGKVMHKAQVPKNKSLCKCRIGDEGFVALASALRSNTNSHLTELNLNDNNPGDSGVKQISDLLKNTNCKLKTLHLKFCSIGDEGFVALASALKSNTNSHLTELNLSYNNPGDSGVNMISDLLKDPNCKLQKLHIESQQNE